VLTIGWKKNAANAVMLYDATRNPAIQTVSGIPIYTISATGRVGQTRRTIVAEVIQKPYTVLAKGAFAADVDIDNMGNAVVCGYNHRSDTPINDGINGRGAMPGDATHCIDNEVATGSVPGIWCSSPLTAGGNSANFGSPDTIGNQGHNNFYSGPWDCFGMSQSEFWQFVGGQKDPSAVSNWNGINYFDNNTVTRDASCAVSPSGVDAEGFMYVDGDLKLNSNFSYKGFIFVEGDITVNGNAWILGGIVCKGKSHIKLNGGMTVLYSSDAITQVLTKYGSQFVTLSWREQ
jgi:hypothetical protein